MPGIALAPKVLRFDGYEVDLSAGLLCKGGLRISLREQSFQVLASLLERPGEVVTREELRHRLWPDNIFVDFDNNLNAAIARLRGALCDSADQPRYIETLPKHGYRFIANVFESPQLPKPGKVPRARLMVLPFINLSGDRTQEYFSDAMTDEVITELAGLAPEQLAVIARTTSMHYRGSHKDVAGIGREVGVDYVVEGGVRREDKRVAINVQLISVKDQTHVWAQRYDGALQDMFKMQGELAQAIAAQVGVTPVPTMVRKGPVEGRPSKKKPTADLLAYNEYIQGRSFIARQQPEFLARARQHFEEAIARDHHFALAYDSLAEIYWWLGYFGFMRPVDAFSTGVLYAVRALEIDNTLGETHALLAQYHKQLDYNWPEVLREMNRALELNPASPIVRARYAFNYLMPHGRLEEAVAELDFALDLDPLSTYFRAPLVITLLLWRHYDRALVEAKRLVELDPNVYWGHLALSVCCRDRGMFKEGLAHCRRAVEFSGEAPAMLGWLGLFLGMAGEKVQARALLKRLRGIAATAYVSPTAFAWIHIGLKEFDAAFEWLHRAVDERDQLMMPIKSYAFMDPIRADPRFAALLRKMHLEV